MAESKGDSTCYKISSGFTNKIPLPPLTTTILSFYLGSLERKSLSPVNWQLKINKLY